MIDIPGMPGGMSIIRINRRKTTETATGGKIGPGRIGTADSEGGAGALSDLRGRSKALFSTPTTRASSI
jgi:hypothetical protein